MSTLQAYFLLIKYLNVIPNTLQPYHLRLFTKTICKRETEPTVKISKNLLRIVKGSHKNFLILKKFLWVPVTETSTGVNKFYGK